MVKLPQLSRRTLLILVAALLLLIALLVTAAYFLLPGFGRRGSDIRIDTALPGRNFQVDLLDPDQVWPGVLGQIKAKLFVPVELDGRRATLLASGYTVTATRERADALTSEQFFADDLLWYGAAVAEQGSESSFAEFMDAFENAFWTGALPYSRLEKHGDGMVSYGGDDWALLLRYERALVLAWQRWPTKRIEQSIRRGLAELKPYFADGRLAKPADLPADVSHFWESAPATPTPLPPAGPRDRIVLMRDLDTFTMRALGAFDGDFRTYADDWQRVLAGGRADVGAPFPAYAVWSDRSDYIFIAEDGFAVRTADLLTTMLYLAEAGIRDEKSLDFLRQALFSGGLSTRYRISDGSPAGEAAGPDLYALAARLGRAAGDSVLNERALEFLMRQHATSATSLIVGAIYRPGAEESFVMTARDNALALLALR